MAEDLYQTTWGRIRLWCSSISTNNSRRQVVHELATGDVHPVQDRGLEARRCTLSLLFDEMPTESASAKERFLAFKAQVDRGDEEIFTHPIDGAYLAKVGECDYEIDEDTNIVSARVEFIATAEIEAVSPAGSGTSSAAGGDAVAARADELNAALESVDISSTVTTDAVAAQEVWATAETVPTRQIIADTAAMSDRLASLIDTEGMEDDLALWPAFRAVIMLGDAFRSSALSATSDTPNVFFMRIGATVSLLALCVRIYRGAEAEDRARQVQDLNDLRTPGWIPAGSELIMPAKSSRRRAF